MESKTVSNNTHTNAEYRCKVYEIKSNFYVVKMCSIVANYGDRKTLHIPRRELYVRKDMIKEKLNKYDYVNIKFTFQDRKYNVTDVLSWNVSPKIESKVIESKKETNIVSKPKVTNIYEALIYSDTESDSD